LTRENLPSATLEPQAVIAEYLEANADNPAAPVVAELPASGAPARQLDYPAETQPLVFSWRYAYPLLALHVLAALAFFPYFFSWTGVALAVFNLYFFNLLGITLCYHRLLTHQGFVVPKWLEHFFALLGVCCLEDTPARWVAIHRIHHKHSDEQPDPHSPLVSFFWGHVGWLIYEHREHRHVMFYEKYARDLLRDPFYMALEKKLLWFWIYLGHALLFYLAGLAIGWAVWGTLAAGAQFGLSILVWGVFVRTVAGLHITWSVNSVGHLWGYRNYATRDDSVNNPVVALFAHGEGWHNNHHAEQRSAAHGHKWWEFDPTWVVIRALEMVGLARNVVRPKCMRKSAEANGAES
jgi:stearoyl-CoA desaturase (delta-9 desaturase)